MRFGITVALSIGLLALPATADAKGRHHHRHHHHYRHHDGATRNYASPGISAVRLADGQIIHVASAYAERFRGFFNALYRQRGRLPHITCLASGHMRHSLHHWGGACDVGQTARNVAPGMMYHVGALAAAHGLTDGCIWHNPDCGHVDVSGVGRTRYASRSRYASLYHHRHAYLYVRHRYHHRRYARA